MGDTFAENYLIMYSNAYLCKNIFNEEIIVAKKSFVPRSAITLMIV